MAEWTKTAGRSVLSLQSVATATVLISSELDVSTFFAAVLFVHLGRRASSALTGGAIIRIEGSALETGDGFWVPLWMIQGQTVAAESEGVDGTCASGQKVIGAASTTNLLPGDIIFLDNSTIGDSEWARIAAVTTNVSVTVEDNLLNAQTGSTIYNKGEMFAAVLDLSALKRLRVVVDTATGPTGQNIAIEVMAVTGDSIG